jgi:hypothetical protein
MKGTGKKINNMGMEKRFGPMEPSLKVIILMGRNREKVFLLGQMAVLIKEIFMKIIFMVEECIVGQMEESIMVLGNATKCMDMESLLGLMVENMKEIM